jgi:predicted permease
MDEVRLAVRRVRLRRAATLASIATLACAIAASATAWSVVSAVLLRPVPVRDPGRLVVLGYPLKYGPAAGAVQDGVVYPMFQAIRDADVFQEVSAQWASALTLNVDGGAGASRASVGFIDRDWLSVLGVPVPLGRPFVDADDRRGATPVALITDRYWRGTLDADPHVIGRSIRIGDNPVTVVGVLPRGFLGTHLADAPDVFLPLQTIAVFGSPLTNYFADPAHPSSPTAGVSVVGRMRPGQTAAEVSRRLNTLPAIASHHDELALLPIETAALPPVSRSSLRRFTMLLGATVACLLLIGCSAVGTLLLTRTEARREEFATCIALGASRMRLAWGVALEGLLLSAAGATLAIPVAAWLMRGLSAFQLPGHIDISRLSLSLDWRTVASAGVAAMFATALVALIAAGAGFTGSFAQALRSRGGTTPVVRRGSRSLLVTVQVALALVLTVGAGLFARSLNASLRLNSGIDADTLVTAYVSLNTRGHASPENAAFFAAVEQRLTTDPAVASVACTASRGSMLGSLTIDGISRPLPSAVTFDEVGWRYFSTMGLAVSEGRGFATADASEAANTVIVSESFAKFIGAGRSALGHRITLFWSEGDNPPAVVTVIGVVPDVVLDVNAAQPLAAYLPLPAAAPDPGRTIVVRAASSAGPRFSADAAKRAIAAALKTVNPTIVPLSMSTISERISRQMTSQQFGLVIVGGLALLAVLLTAVTASVLADSLVGLRRREMGIRAALGATASQLAGIVLYENARLVSAGVVCGFAVVWLASRSVRALLFQVQPLDPATLALAAYAIGLIAALVSLKPALRAARADVAQDLRQE